MEKPMVCIAVVGAGYASRLHSNGYSKVNGVQVRLKTIVDIQTELAEKMKVSYGFEQAIADFDEALADPEIDIIDICTPPFMHPDMVKKALAAGKHVICEKPLVGYFGMPGDKEPIGKNVSKRKMFEQVCSVLDDLKAAVEASGSKFFYAENYVYSPSIIKAAEIISAKKSKILFLKGEESLSGSSSPVAGQWKYTGGGSLIRVGCHPLAGVIWLKLMEGKARGEDITIQSVSADMGVASECLNGDERKYMKADPKDVEDFSNVTVTFSDRTKAVILSCDVTLGGTKNYVEIYCNDHAQHCTLTQTNLLDTFFLDEDNLDDVYLAERMPTKLGWNKAYIADEIVRGYTGELQNFVESVAYDQDPISDFRLAYETAKAVYAAYLAAEEGIRVDF